MATHPLNTETTTMHQLTICRGSGERIGTCKCATCRLNRGEHVELQTRLQASGRAQGGEA